MQTPTDTPHWLELAIAEAVRGVEAGDGGPFGAVIVRSGVVVATAHNTVIRDGDPTAHAEVNAIREAARTLGTHVLTGAVLYASCEPCPMCAGAALWSRVDACVYAATRDDAAAVGFDDAAFHARLASPDGWAQHVAVRPELRTRPFDAWTTAEDATLY